MTATVEAPPAPARAPRSARILRWIGWTLITAGCVVLLYLVYSLLFTNLETSAAQDDLRAGWERDLAAASTPVEADEDPTVAPEDPPAEPDDPAPVDTGGAVALIEFHRPGSDVRPVRDDPLFVVDSVTVQALKAGPGHYPGTALPGEEGNFAVAGHRTTYGAPFFHLDQLQEGDEIHVGDRTGATHVYVVREQRVVTPADTWVIGPDPLETAGATLTLTTCHPRFSAAQRLIVFAELVS